MHAKVKKMEDEIKKDFLCKKTKMIRQGACDPDDRVKAYCRELIRLMPCLGPHIAKFSDQGSVLQVVKCTIPAITMEGEDSP